MILIIMAAWLYASRDGVREIRHADRISNFALADGRPGADDWPCWRGRDGRNVGLVHDVPSHWTAATQGGWQIDLPGRGHSTPTAWGDQLFLLTAEADRQRVSLRSYDRNSGRERWWTELHRGGLPQVHEKNSHATATPACDGQSVFVATVGHGRLWVTAVDLEGRLVWQREAGSYWTKLGYRSSPVLYKSLVIVSADQRKGSYLTAFHRQTGEIVWRIKRPDGESFGTPIVGEIAGRSQLVLGGKGLIMSYNPATGEELWRFQWAAERVANSIAFNDQCVFATSRLPLGEVVCIQADGTGDVTKSHLTWRQVKIGSEIPSPVCHENLLYVLSDDGQLTCLDSLSGKIEWRKRLQGSYSASPIVAGRQLICGNETGLSYIIQTGVQFDAISENRLPEGIMASPIVCGRSVYLRTTSQLFKFADSANEPIVEKPDSRKRRL
ncbi:outer membrane protein assembly factor BamB family protein [Schlesneria paludicola]|uniref:outer membrane protein assembly factor BamB family protein n=1 Tax=Schlesneria paludicola TaxID=360056 RepID=UPI00029B48B3|nr:PQQ-binding-like beta-propeller repeat protein [Schlesneria paludicola]